MDAVAGNQSGAPKPGAGISAFRNFLEQMEEALGTQQQRHFGN